MKKDHNNRRKNRGVVNYIEPESEYPEQYEVSAQTVATLEERLRLQDLIPEITTIFINLPPGI